MSSTREIREVKDADLPLKTPDKSDAMRTSTTIEQSVDEQYHQANTTGAATENALMMSNVTTPLPRPEQVEDQSDKKTVLNEEYWENKDLSKQPLPLDWWSSTPYLSSSSDAQHYQPGPIGEHVEESDRSTEAWKGVPLGERSYLCKITFSPAKSKRLMTRALKLRKMLPRRETISPQIHPIASIGSQARPLL